MNPCGPARMRRLQGLLNRKKNNMLWTICVILIVLWLLGMVTSTTMGGLVHVLLVVAIIMVLVNLISGRKGV